MMKQRRNEKKSTYRILGIIFVILLGAFLLANALTEDQDSSDMENRSLSQRPNLSWQSVISGRYMERFESYASDQFVGRNIFREIYVGFRRFGGSREENGVFYGNGKQLLEDISVPEEEILKEDTEGLNAYAVRYPDVNMHILLVPDAATILSDCLPHFATVADQEVLFEDFHSSLDQSIIWMDGVAAMKSFPDDKRYYQTDHHWTTLGAYDVFLETAKDLGIEDPEEIVYESCCAASDFNGSLAATSGFLLGMEEELTVYLPKEDISYLTTYVEETERSSSLFSVDALDTRDKYEVFFGGNHSLIEIETVADDERTLMVVKDSFANCYIPFLVPYYSRIIVVDPRYYVGDIGDLTDTYSVTDTLFLYSGNTFFTDSNLKDFLSFDSTSDSTLDSVIGTISEE